jgi:transglutaminase-like putative cysteine protease
VTWRLSISHRSGYRYSAPVSSSYNEVRITPLSTATQLVLESSVEVSPTARPYRYRDYWGTVVHAFDLHQAHTELTVAGRSLVETAAMAPSGDGVGWAQLAEDATADRFSELLTPTRYVPVGGAVEDAAGRLADARMPYDAVHGAMDWVRGALRYEAGVTNVATAADEALGLGAGVCQDFTHLLLSVLRTLGVPCRYASGYLHPDADAAIGEAVQGESHAWVEAWTGEWWGIDPTVGRPVGERHVLVARGRDYADVAPLKGVYHGGPSESVGVSVELTRMG